MFLMFLKCDETFNLRRSRWVVGVDDDLIYSLDDMRR
jgi:hypothetical protein